MKSPVIAVCLTTLITLSTPLIAADTQAPPAYTESQNTFNQLFQMRLAIQRSIGAFYMFNGQEQDQQYAKTADENAIQATRYVRNLTTPNSPSAQDLKAQLLNDVNAYSAQLDRLISAIQEQGYSDLQPVADLAALNSNILKNSEALVHVIGQEQHYTAPELTQLAREQSLLMQGIAADYAARSASVGASFFADGEKQPLDQLSKQFARNLSFLQEHPSNNPSTKQSLRAIEVKWRYIENSLKNYNENSVPFVIDKYARSITQGLEQVAAQYALLNI
ncbi:hypothetical protein FXF61_04685 [Pseudomonas sp. C27(2019)]|uniref:hypothetical protein n=1 Tax=Pseudomonas sp. C27(2019) TaxID=2604941 RepID=UPI001244B6B0|nr:hypothetical protein [Pseudomonas sp. C27(2019)]QEY58502.1 hypothetical protein FXF61_04685 [Pseudomonas sp. C27(2019)]